MAAERLPRIAVVGGGISGLAAAHRLVELSRERRQPIDLRLLEAGERLGGVIATERSDGYVIESGPDSFLSEKPAALQLCDRLHVADKLVGTREAFRRTLVVRGGRLDPIPEGFVLLAPTRLWPLIASPLFSWSGKLRMALDLVLPRGGGGDESAARFVTRRLGREAFARVAQPLVCGIYTADPERLSVAAALPRLRELERAHRSLILGMWRQQRRAALAARGVSSARWSLFLSFDAGMQSLVEYVARALPEGIVRLRAPVRALERVADGWRLDGDAAYDAVIVATPAHAAAALLRGSDADLAGELAAIPHASCAIVSLVFSREAIPHPLDAFGFVVPSIEQRALLAGTFSSLKFPGRAPAAQVLVRAFVGGALRPELVDLDDATLSALVGRELADLLGVRAAPLLTRIARWPHSMPQYDLGHLDRVGRITRRLAALPDLRLAGNAYDGVGIPDCIRSGETAAEAAMQIVSERASALTSRTGQV